jgi:hypothetical protein
VAGLAEVLPRLTASPALHEDADGRAVEGTMSPPRIGATVLCGTLTLKENSQPLQYLRGATLSSGPKDVPVPEHQLDLDSAYAVVTRQEHYELKAGLHSGAVWYTPGLLQALNVLVPARNATNGGTTVGEGALSEEAAAWEDEVRLGAADGGCLPSIVDFAIQSDVAAHGAGRKRTSRAANPLSTTAHVEDGGGLSAEHVMAGDSSAAVEQEHASRTHFLRNLTLVRGVCINVDQVHRMHSASSARAGLDGNVRAQDYDGLMHMFKCLQFSLTRKREREGGGGSESEAELALDSVAIGKAADTGDRLVALADFAVRHSVHRQLARECARAWSSAPVVLELVELVRLLQQHKQKVFLKSDGLADFTHSLAQALGVPDRYVVANSFTYSPDTGFITGITGPGGHPANSVEAVLAKVREHKQALKHSAYLLIGGTPGDYAARRSSPHGADLLITLNHSGLPHASPHTRSEGGQGADWNAHSLADVTLAFQLGYMMTGEGVCTRAKTFVLV